MTDTIEEKEVEASRYLKKVLRDTEDALKEQNNLLASNDSARRVHTLLTEENVALEHKKTGLEREVEKLTTVKTSYETSIDEQNETIKVTDEAIKTKKRALKDVETALTNLEEEVKATRATAEADASRIMHTAQVEVTRLTTEKDALEADIATLEAKKVKQAKENDEAKAELVRVNNDITAANTLLNETNREFEGKQRMLALLLADLKTGTEKLKTVTEQVKTEEEVLSDLSSRKPALEAEIAQLEALKEEEQKKYEVEKAKLFNIARREQHVQQQEAHIRDQFQLAGVPYTEFSPQ